ncbi:hypothetical protein CYMTET_3646 [Cymbomonas tetramitiformis]|uniref:Uncharacterized protein n=1 Tax=Cymbomonas tetramitiformis TaxID=36881 RepID=A0AAE0H2S2_9CHLO|nr:hypothetical protein CYMTET_3646 [Cymbomonas tetramitiformis]
MNQHALQAVDGVGMTPLHTAAAFSTDEIVGAILARHPQAASVRDKRRRFPLHLALSGVPNKPSFQPSSAKVQLLLEFYPKAANTPDDTDRYALHYICLWESMLSNIGKVLKYNPAAAKFKDVLGFFPLQLMLMHSDPPHQAVDELAAIFPQAARHESQRELPQVLQLEGAASGVTPWGTFWQNQQEVQCVPTVHDADMVMPWTQSDDDKDTAEDIDEDTARKNSIKEALNAAHEKAVARAEKVTVDMKESWCSSEAKEVFALPIQSLRDRHGTLNGQKRAAKEENVLAIKDISDDDFVTRDEPSPKSPDMNPAERRLALQQMVIEGVGANKFLELYNFLSQLPPLLVGDFMEEEILARKIELEHMMEREEHMAYWPLLDEIIFLQKKHGFAHIDPVGA